MRATGWSSAPKPVKYGSSSRSWPRATVPSGIGCAEVSFAKKALAS
jgi:hypothetical protein